MDWDFIVRDTRTGAEKLSIVRARSIRLAFNIYCDIHGIEERSCSCDGEKLDCLLAGISVSRCGAMPV
jgi:hypothetical protein